MASIAARLPAMRTALRRPRRGFATAGAYDPAVYPPNVVPPYAKLLANLDVVKRKLGRPLTLAEKIVYSHLADPSGPAPVRGESYLKLSPGGLDRLLAALEFQLIDSLPR